MSKKLILECPKVVSTNWSIFEIEKGSFGHAQFKSIKSTQALHFPFLFFTTIVFGNHSGKNTSLIAPTYLSFSTSSFMACTCWLVDLLGFCFLGGDKGSIFNLWVMKSRSTPGTSYGLYAKTSKFCTKARSMETWSPNGRLFPIWKYLSLYGRILIWINFSALLAPVSTASSNNCYNDSGSTCSFSLISWLIAITKHCRATYWSPLTTTIPSSVGNLTFMCSVDSTTPMAWIHDQPIIVI